MYFQITLINDRYSLFSSIRLNTFWGRYEFSLKVRCWLKLYKDLLFFFKLTKLEVFGEYFVRDIFPYV